MDRKTCVRCSTEKPVDQFYARSPGKYRSECKKCTGEANAARRAATPPGELSAGAKFMKEYNQRPEVKARQAARRADPKYREEARRRTAKWREENLERDRENARRYAAEHREEARERTAQWRRDNPEREQANKKAYYRNNAEKVKEATAAYREEHEEELAEARRRRRVEFPDLMKAIDRENHAKRKARKAGAATHPFTETQLAEKVAFWGNRCWVCGGEWNAMDHVKPLAKGGAHMLCNLRPICTSCNSAKCDKWPFTGRAEIRRLSGPTKQSFTA